MTGRQTGDQSQLFYNFNLERCIPAGVCTKNSSPVVMMVKPAEDRVRTNDSGLLNRTKIGASFVQRPMRSDGVVVSGIGN